MSMQTILKLTKIKHRTTYIQNVDIIMPMDLNSKVHEILSLTLSFVLGACRCSLIAGVPKTACNFQHQEYAALPR